MNNVGGTKVSMNMFEWIQFHSRYYMVKPSFVIVIGVSKNGFWWIAKRYVGDPGSISQDILWVKPSVVCLLSFVFYFLSFVFCLTFLRIGSSGYM